MPAFSANGQLAGEQIERLPGYWTRGEFATLPANLFDAPTSAHFAYKRDASHPGLRVSVYGYEVKRANSRTLPLLIQKLPANRIESVPKANVRTILVNDKGLGDGHIWRPACT